ncbi:MAG: hypothetical protein RLZZ238_1357 [Planctomycetota bacterium]|jgi:hypothetical protein
MQDPATISRSGRAEPSAPPDETGGYGIPNVRASARREARRTR